MNQRSELFLIANLGSEVAKIFSAKKSGNNFMLETALKKTESMMSELKNIPETKENKEIEMLADIVGDFKETNHKYNIPKEDFEAYFYPFAVRLMQVNHLT